MKDALARFLPLHGLTYSRFEHPPVYTCEDAWHLAPELPGAETKNLFLCEVKGRRHFLRALPATATADLRLLSDVLEVKRLRLASADGLLHHSGSDPGGRHAAGGLQRSGQCRGDSVEPPALVGRSRAMPSAYQYRTPRFAPRSLARFLALTRRPPRSVDMSQPASSARQPADP
ncbi:YbaK/EbsC family protein [Gulbenkiania mobilis]|uniref:YbaK/EbsC family protein n=1 Tax=Gulbenkiania mobilis TaxID=397457 RepID=UPI00296EB84D